MGSRYYWCPVCMTMLDSDDPNPVCECDRPPLTPRDIIADILVLTRNAKHVPGKATYERADGIIEALERVGFLITPPPDPAGGA